MVVFNYAVRILTILVGIFFLTGKLFYDHPYKTELQVIGGLLVIWGIYRIFSYRKALKELKDEEDSNN
ncbi:hypothetical protein D9V84_08560 [Bacteroidetes/Chlorobi group bacterium Naka2016]|nr:MAG: hypothetical protein D9V84_08560 [Bacteroidetes/Chlorobi group bacterium Naka2016]